jgi:hypothetical protein
MLWIKAFHILFVVSWFAGLFYLPRIFVNLAMVPADSVAERERLLLMAGKLFRFMTPLGVLAIGAGPLALVRLRLYRRLAARQDRAGDRPRRLPRLVRHAAGRVPHRQLDQEPCLVPLLQRGAGAGLVGDMHPGRGQALLICL